MLERLQRIAIRLRPLLPLAVAVGVGGLAVFLWSSTRNVPAERDTYLIPGLLATLWGALLFTFITGLRQVPALPAPQDSLWRRLRARLARGVQHVIAWLILGAAAAALFMSFRLLALWWR